MQVIKGFFLLLLIYRVDCIKFFKSVRYHNALPCGTEDIISKFSRNLEGGYNVTIKKMFTVATDVRLVFDSEASVLLDKEAKFTGSQDNIYNIFNFILIQNTESFTFTVLGHAAPYSPPYLTSLKINGEEYCRNHNLTYFEAYPVGVTSRESVPDRYCGKRKVLHTELIVNGLKTKPGDWPWHVAIYRQQKYGLQYVCGGTLITKLFVLTAAHCTTVNGISVNPELVGVFLGKYNLYGNDQSLQERQVLHIIVHDEYNSRSLVNDIAMLKLKTEAVFNNFVQPACLWYDEIYLRLSSSETFGTVVGWGFDSSDSLSATLHTATLPQIEDLTCILTNPLFYGTILRDGKKFCAGYNNGTSACNGDSGGGFVVFVPDLANSNTTKPVGAWYIKGIVSATLSRSDAAICDPNSFSVFIDVSKYLKWIKDAIT